MSSRAGWASTLGEFVVTDVDDVVSSLLTRYPGAPEQLRAWRSSIDAVRRAGVTTIAAVPPAREHGTVLEYELPMEGGRRPDVLVLQNGRVVVLEFKESAIISRADLDQVAAYARDIKHYHEPSHDLDVVPVLVRAGRAAQMGELHGVKLVTPSALGTLLIELAQTTQGSPIDLVSWLGGAYRPLPALVHAARLLFDRQALPRVKVAESKGVPDTVCHVLGCACVAAERGEHHLVLLNGVPGAGKTLVGLQTVHDAVLDEIVGARGRGAPAAFLSGNGPLVTVLQYAISGRGRERSAEKKVFVRNMHEFIRELAFVDPTRVPDCHLVVFDEAQRSWDLQKMRAHYSKTLSADQLEATVRSEPEHILRIAARVPRWSLVVALLGTGQEIHTGEEAGLAQWAEAGLAQWADAARAVGGLHVHGPPALAPYFGELPYEPSDRLSLDNALRSHVASDVPAWVSSLLDAGDLDRCAWIARKLASAGFPILLTRSLADTRAYARDRYAGEPERRYGLIASSKASELAEAYGLDPTITANRFPRIDKWFCEGPSDPKSCCRLDRVASEFLCQGLELDLPIVCWGTDFLWAADRWLVHRKKRSRPNPMIRDAQRLRTNAYRVLLTRGRDGLVLWVPPDPVLDATADALRSAGAADLELDVEAAPRARGSERP